MIQRARRPGRHRYRSWRSKNGSPGQAASPAPRRGRSPRAHRLPPHRTDGPAVEFYYGDKYWWVDGKRHRLDGPAVDCADGTKVFYVNNINIEDLKEIPRITQQAIALQDLKLFEKLLKQDKIDRDIKDKYSHLVDLGNIGIL